MKAIDLYESLNGLNDEILLRSERHVRASRPLLQWGVAAACLCLILTAVFFASRSTPPTPSFDDPDSAAQFPPDYAVLPGEITFNTYETGAEIVGDGSLRANFCIFGEDLLEEELAAASPASLPDWADAHGTALYYGWGELESVYLEFLRQEDGTIVYAHLREPEKPVYSDVVYPLPDPTVTAWGDFTFTAYRYGNFDASWTTLEATFERCGTAYRLTANGPTDTAADLERMLSDLLLAYAHTDTALDLASLSMRLEHTYQNETLTLTEALNDPDFGGYFPSAPSASWQDEGARRYQDDNSNYLSGLWTKGLNELSWRISYYREKDAARLTAVADTRNYDLALYPIPRADSVPEELREIVDNPIFRMEELTLETVYKRAYHANDSGDTDGWRMRFSVLYGDGTLVTVSSKGVSPEWVYETLQNLASPDE